MWPLYMLRHAGVDVTLFFFNPNVHPSMEWRRRMENASKAAACYEVPLVAHSLCDPHAWRERAEDDTERCRYCYRVRPWQDREMLIEEGVRACEPYSIQFVPCDWRDGYRRGQQMAKERGLYRQKYCGCILSLESSDFYESIACEHDTLAFQETLTRCDQSLLVKDGIFDESLG
jgi:predicted adenine nucleotide alpha hydrolase (AANH) superfamily ATPase